MLWKKTLLARGAEVFEHEARPTSEPRIAELEQLLGKKEVEIALLKKRLGPGRTGMIMHHDQDPAFISYEWAREILVHSGARLSYALHGAKDNPEMESFFGRFKVENQSLLMDAMTIAELRALVARRMKYYKQKRRHSSLGN
jgi:putative transposase